MDALVNRLCEVSQTDKKSHAFAEQALTRERERERERGRLQRKRERDERARPSGIKVCAGLGVQVIGPNADGATTNRNPQTIEANPERQTPRPGPY